MTLADQAAIAGHDGQVGSSGRPQRRTFTAAYKAKILAEYEQAGPGQRGAILRREALTTGHISDWRKTRDKGGRKEPAPRPAGRPGRSAQEVENERLRNENEKLAAELARTKAALEVVGKAHALLSCSPRARTPTRSGRSNRRRVHRAPAAHLRENRLRAAREIPGHAVQGEKPETARGQGGGR